MEAASAPRRWWRTKMALASLVVVVASGYSAILIVRHTAELERVAPVPFLAGDDMLNIAHRGASGYATEHTLEAYRRALELGADVLELDVRQTADGELVVMHDETLERTAGIDARVADLTLAELRARAGEHAPLTLEQVIGELAGVRFNVEIKDDARSAAARLAQIVDRDELRDRVLVASFHRDPLRHFRSQSGGRVATSASGSEAIRFYLCYLMDVPCRAHYSALQVAYNDRIDLGKRSFIDFAHRHGLEVHYWTVNDEPSIRRLIANGADGIMTDYPDRVARVLAQERR